MPSHSGAHERRKRALRLVLEHRRESVLDWAAVTSIATNSKAGPHWHNAGDALRLTAVACSGDACQRLA